MTFENTENPTIEQSPQEQMVEQQIRTWEVLDTDVLDVMQNIPRENFFPERLKSFSQTDSSFQIRKDFLMPPPSVQGKILQALSIDSEDAILQLGSGSGYLTACLAELGGHVYTVGCEQTELESIKDVCTELNIKNIGFVERPWNTMLSAIENQYDTVVSQYAFKQFPEELKQALKLNGVAVCFVGKAPIISCVRVERISENEWVEENLFETLVSDFPVASKTKASFTF